MSGQNPFLSTCLDVVTEGGKEERGKRQKPSLPFRKVTICVKMAVYISEERRHDILLMRSDWSEL